MISPSGLIYSSVISNAVEYVLINQLAICNSYFVKTLSSILPDFYCLVCLFSPICALFMCSKFFLHAFFFNFMSLFTFEINISTMSVMDWILFTQNSYAKSLIPHVTVLGDSTIKEVIKVKWGHKSGDLFQVSWCPYTKRKRVCFLPAHTDRENTRWGVIKSRREINPETICTLIMDFWEKATAPHSSTLAWKIPWTEEPGGLQSMGSLRVGSDWATSLSLFTFMHWRRKWQPTPVFLPGESQGWGVWWAAFYGVTQSRTRLKQFSSSSSMAL